MKAIILAAGYATRLYPLTLNWPKALLKVNSKPIVEHIVNRLKTIEEIDGIIIVTNNKFYIHFAKWLEKINSDKKIKLINDLTSSEENRLGAIGDLNFAIQENNLDADILVVAGDNLFNFDLKEFIKFAKGKPGITIGVYDIKDINKANKFGVIEMDSLNQITKFVEKPEKPFSTLIGTGIYFIPKSALGFIKAYLEKDNHPDVLGCFLEYLLEKKVSFWGYRLSGNWFDIGDFEVYKIAKEHFSKERS